MDDKENIKQYLSLILLDIIGVNLFALGVAKKWFDLELLPRSLQFSNYELIFIVLGILLMLPFMFHIYAKVRRKSEEKLVK